MFHEAWEGARRCSGCSVPGGGIVALWPWGGGVSVPRWVGLYLQGDAPFISGGAGVGWVTVGLLRLSISDTGAIVCREVLQRLPRCSGFDAATSQRGLVS
jgi:hypothetical protein